MAENQNYSIIGKVEIGTDEYRDLICSMLENKQNYDRARDKTGNLKEKYQTLKKSLAQNFLTERKTLLNLLQQANIFLMRHKSFYTKKNNFINPWMISNQVKRAV